MILWTIQHIEAYREMQQTGRLCANEEYIYPEDKFAYQWMAEKLCEKAQKPAEEIQYPVWAWYQWEGRRKRRDLRCSGYAKRGTELVQLTIDVPDEQVLLSDFDTYHFVLGNFYLPESKEDAESFKNELEQSGMTYHACRYINDSDTEAVRSIQERIIKSWDRVLDIDDEMIYCGCAQEERSIQAVMWEVKMEWVKKVERFRAK